MLIKSVHDLHKVINLLFVILGWRNFSKAHSVHSDLQITEFILTTLYASRERNRLKDGFTFFKPSIYNIHNLHYYVNICCTVGMTVLYWYWSWKLLFDCVPSWAWCKQKVVVFRDKTSLSVFSALWMFSKESPSLPSLKDWRSPNLTLAGTVRK